MSPIAHCGVALAARRLAPKAPLGILLIAATFLDLLLFTLMLVGIERAGDQLALIDYPWSHGLFMSVLWSVAIGALTCPLFRDRRASLVIGLVVPESLATGLHRP